MQLQQVKSEVLNTHIANAHRYLYSDKDGMFEWTGSVL